MSFSGDKATTDKKETRTSIGAMTLFDLTKNLEALANVCAFNGHGASDRINKNYRHMAMWANMGVEDFRERRDAARKEGKNIDVVSGAMTHSGAIRMPVDDSDKYLSVVLMDIITMQRERILRVDYAKQKELEEFGAM